jgi:hypothetical protein
MPQELNPIGNPQQDGLTLQALALAPITDQSKF